MKKLIYSLIFMGGLGALITACGDEFLAKSPTGALTVDVLASPDGVEGLLVGAYATLDGWVGWSTTGAPWLSAGSNWVFGDVYADDSYKGSDAGDQADILNMEKYVTNSSNPYPNGKWRATYDGIARCNDLLRVLAEGLSAGNIDAGLATQIEAEAKFLRGHYHFEVARLFDNVPYVDETNTDGLVANSGTPWAQIEADLQFGVDNLPAAPRKGQVGRATTFAAHGLLAKVKLAQGQYREALDLLNPIIDGGAFSLPDNYHDNFRCEGDNNSESIFQIQNSINDGSGEGANGNYGDILNFPYTGGPAACCGFYQPTQNLVNAYKTDGGLPMLDDFNDSDVDSDQGVAAEDAFTPYAGELDPRLDWAVGRRGIPYLDWGDHPGITWIRDQNFAGPYSPKKNVFYQSEQGACSNAGGWGGGTTGNNHSILRYADVLLMAAECEVEVGDLEAARAHVNTVRTRAANSDHWVKRADGTDAANYVINTYDGAWTDQGVARKAVRFERRLELSMEGHRFFDLKRWGVAEQVINEYISKEQNLRSYLSGTSFSDKFLRLPIPQSAIDESKGTLTQNAGY